MAKPVANKGGWLGRFCGGAWVRRIGLIAFAFFFLKGLAWLGVAALVAYGALRA